MIQTGFQPAPAILSVCRTFVARRCALAVAILALVPVPLQPASSLAAQDQGQVEEQVKAVLELEEVAWLREHSDRRSAMSFPGGAVYFAGFFREGEISDDILATLSMYPLIPNILLVDPGTVRIESTEQLWFDVPGRPGSRCLALMQIVYGQNEVVRGDGLEQIVSNLQENLPERPLNENCDVGEIPPPPEGFLDRQTFRTNYPVLREAPGSCSDFPPIEASALTLVPNMRIDFRSIYLGDTLPRSEYDQPVKHFDFFMRGFRTTLQQNGAPNISVFPYGNYAPRAHDLAVDLRLIEDVNEDVFCYIADVVQDDRRSRFTLRIPRAGKTLPWSPHEGRSFDPGTQLIDFGTAVATALRPEF